MSDKIRVTGRVKKVYDKKWPAGNTTYSITLEDHAPFYRMPRGPKKGSDGERFAGIVEPGNLVTFEATQIDEKSMQITGRITAAEEPKQSGGAAAPAAGGGSYAARDSSIQYQSSRKDALQFVDLLVRTSAVKLPEKQAAKLEAIEALVDHYTAQFTRDINTMGALARADGTDEAEGGESSSEDEE